MRESRLPLAAWMSLFAAIVAPSVALPAPQVHVGVGLGGSGRSRRLGGEQLYVHVRAGGQRERVVLRVPRRSGGGVARIRPSPRSAGAGRRGQRPNRSVAAHGWDGIGYRQREIAGHGLAVLGRYRLQRVLPGGENAVYPVVSASQPAAASVAKSRGPRSVVQIRIQCRGHVGRRPDVHDGRLRQRERVVFRARSPENS